MITLLIFVAVLAVLVLSHEFGHFIAARKSGMRVYEFGFGFAPRLIGAQMIKDKKTGQKKWQVIFGKKDFEAEEQNADLYEYGTVYSLNLFPLGGFCRIKGEEGGDNSPDSFGAQKPWKKAITLAAGVAMNAVLAWILISIGFMMGMPQSIDEMTDLSKVKDRRLEIVQVMSGKPAELGGLKAGDSIIKIDNLTAPRLKQMQSYVDANKDKNITITVQRGDRQITQNIKPFVYSDTGKGGIGVALVESGLVQYPWYLSLWQGLLTTGGYIKAIFVAFYFLLKGLFSGAGAGEALSGPVGIAVMTGAVARLGFSYLLNFIALLSINLAIINILPIPALDGGRLLFLGIAKIKGRPISQKWENLSHTIGFALLMLLILFITIKDIGTFKSNILNFFHRII